MFIIVYQNECNAILIFIQHYISNSFSTVT